MTAHTGSNRNAQEDMSFPAEDASRISLMAALGGQSQWDTSANVNSTGIGISTRRTSLTPPPNPPNERIVESWIRQSLTIPSASNDNNNENLGGGGNPALDYLAEYVDVPARRRASAVANPSTTTKSLEDFEEIFGSLRDSNDNGNGNSDHPYGQCPWGSKSMLGADDSFFMAASNSNLFSNVPVARDREGEAGKIIKPRSGTITNIVSSDIHDAARIGNWETVATLCQEKPEAAAYIGADGWTALHHVCNRRCPHPKVVESLIRAYPDALLIAEEKVWLPLHYACRFKAPKDVVALLLHMHPEKGREAVSRPDRRGRSPLYYAVRYDAPSGVAGLLIKMDASAVLSEDQNADSPLALVWNSWAEKSDGKNTLEKVLMGTEDDLNPSMNFHNSINNFSINNLSFNTINQSSLEDRIQHSKLVRTRLERHSNVLQRWNKVNMLLKAAFGFPLNEDWELGNSNINIHQEEEKKDTQEKRKWRVLHAVSAIKCHHTLFLLAFSLYPEQAFELDRNDLRCLHNTYQSTELNGNANGCPSNLTALHLAASSHLGGDPGRRVMTQLLWLNPSAAKRVDTEGSTPLHRISENKFKSNWNFVNDIFASNTDAITKMDVNGRLPLHRASNAITYFSSNTNNIDVQSKSVICRLLREHVDAASSADHFGCMPLHLLAQNGSGWDEQAQALYDANPDAARIRTGVKLGNRLPLHLAAENTNSDFTMIHKLVEYHPRGASQADRKGLYPMHLACLSGHSWNCVQSIHEAYPMAVQQVVRNKKGWTALHMAASSENSDSELLSELVRAYPYAAQIQDADGRYPLHVACTTDKDWQDCLLPLFKAYPNAVQCQDKFGMLPLHIVALRSRVCAKVTDIRRPCLSLTSEAFEKDRLVTAKEQKEAQLRTNIFEMLKAYPAALKPS